MSGISEDQHNVLKYETNSLLENFPADYLPDQFVTDKENAKLGQKLPDALKFINTSDFSITDYTGIPSSATLMTTEASNIIDVRKFKQKKLDVREKTWGLDNFVSDDLKL